MKLSTIAFAAAATVAAASSNEPAAQGVQMPAFETAAMPDSVMIKDVHATDKEIFVLFNEEGSGKQGVAVLTFEQAAEMGLITMGKGEPGNNIHTNPDPTKARR